MGFSNFPSPEDDVDIWSDLQYDLVDKSDFASDFLTIYYDPARFTKESDLQRLEWAVLNRLPAHRQKTLYFQAVSRDSLNFVSPFTDGKVERRFLARGHVTDCEDLPASAGTPTYTVQHQASLRALQYSVVVAEAVISTTKRRLGDSNCPTWLKHDTIDILGIVTGKRTSRILDSDEQKFVRGCRNLPLVVWDNIFFGCSDFTQKRTVIATDYHSAETILNGGKGILYEFQQEPNKKFQELIAREIADVGSSHLAGLALWACQRVAFCRIGLEEARWHHSPFRKQAAARRFKRMNLKQALQGGFRSWAKIIRAPQANGAGNFVTLRSEPIYATEELLQLRDGHDPLLTEDVDVSTITAALIKSDDDILTNINSLYQFNWEKPEIKRLQNCLRNYTERAYLGSFVPPCEDRSDHPCEDLQKIAAWLGDLRRWGYGFLTAELAFCIDRALRTGDDQEYNWQMQSASGQAALRYLKSLMPSKFWNDMDVALDEGIEVDRPVQVIYNYGTRGGPVWHPIVTNGTAEIAATIVSQGPLLDFPYEETALWTARASRLGPDGLLIKSPCEKADKSTPRD